jgi:hypothetical protein
MGDESLLCAIKELVALFERMEAQIDDLKGERDSCRFAFEELRERACCPKCSGPLWDGCVPAGQPQHKGEGSSPRPVRFRPSSRRPAPSYRSDSNLVSTNAIPRGVILRRE